MDKESNLIQVRKEKISQLKDNKVNLYPNDFKPSCSIKKLREIIQEKPDSLGEKGESTSYVLIITGHSSLSTPIPIFFYIDVTPFPVRTYVKNAPPQST